jgi:chromate transporter
LLAGGAASASIGPWLVLVLLGCGVTELAVRRARDGTPRPEAAAGKVPGIAALPVLAKVSGAVAGGAGLAEVAWASLKVGALSFGEGRRSSREVRADAVRASWMTRWPV